LIVKKLDIYNEDECTKWESFVLSNGYLYHSYKWSHILKKSYNFEPLYLYLDDNGEIVSVFPLIFVNFPFVKNELVSVPHVEAGGIVNEKYFEYFFKYLQNNFKNKNILIYQFKNEIGDFPKNEVNSLFMLEMPKSEDELFKYLRKGFKRSAKNLLTNTDVEVIKGNSETFVNLLYKFNVIKSKEFGVPHHSFDFFTNLVESFNDNALIFVAKKDGNPIGASFIIFYNKIGYHIYHFVPDKFLKMKVGLILYCHIFSESLRRGMKIFSFGRSPKGSGVYKFKMQMKATPYPLYIYNFSIKDKLYAEKIKIISEKYSWAAEIWKKLPDGFTNYISPLLRKWVY